jgi:hypothetical protein
MPRTTHTTSYTIDLCNNCTNSLTVEGLQKVVGENKIERYKALELIGELRYGGEDHPPYEYENYICGKCKQPLTETDN